MPKEYLIGSGNLRDRNWDREQEKGLPDSRLSGYQRESNTIWYAKMKWEKVFCASCGNPGGAVTPEFSAHVFYLCDECAKKYASAPPGTVEVKPDTKQGNYSY